MTMYDENSSAAAEISAIAADACRELFSAYGIEIGDSQATARNPGELLYCGVMGFVGRTVRGMCLLGATKPLLEKCCPAGDSLRDWMGELTNQLVGRIKTKLLARGVEIALTSPVVLKGDHIAPVPRRALNPDVFVPEHGSVMLWVEIETSSPFSMAPISLDDQAPKEGEAFFF